MEHGYQAGPVAWGAVQHVAPLLTDLGQGAALEGGEVEEEAVEESLVLEELFDCGNLRGWRSCGHQFAAVHLVWSVVVHSGVVVMGDLADRLGRVGLGFAAGGSLPTGGESGVHGSAAAGYSGWFFWGSCRGGIASVGRGRLGRVVAAGAATQDVGDAFHYACLLARFTASAAVVVLGAQPKAVDALRKLGRGSLNHSLSGYGGHLQHSPQVETNLNPLKQLSLGSIDVLYMYSSFAIAG